MEALNRCQELAGLVEQYGEGQSVRTGPSLKQAPAGSPHIIGANRATRTLSKPDGICSSGVGQHLVKARHATLPYNARSAEVHPEDSVRLVSKQEIMEFWLARSLHANTPVA